MTRQIPFAKAMPGRLGWQFRQDISHIAASGSRFPTQGLSSRLPTVSTSQAELWTSRHQYDQQVSVVAEDNNTTLIKPYNFKHPIVPLL